MPQTLHSILSIFALFHNHCFWNIQAYRAGRNISKSANNRPLKNTHTVWGHGHTKCPWGWSKHLKRLRSKRSSAEGEDALIILPWWSLAKGFVLIPSPCQHLVPKLVLLYLSHILECSQPTTLKGWLLSSRRLPVWLCTVRMPAGHQDSCWRGEEVGSCKQGGHKEGLRDALRCDKSQSTTSFNSQAGRAACWEATRNKGFLSEQKSGSGSESKKQNGQRSWGLFYAGGSSVDQTQGSPVCGPL